MNYTTMLFWARIFWTRESVINYICRKIVMNGEIVVNFHLKPSINKTEPCRLTLRARTENIIDLKLLTDTHETVHTFYVLGKHFELHYDAILDKDFLEECN